MRRQIEGARGTREVPPAGSRPFLLLNPIMVAIVFGCLCVLPVLDSQQCRAPCAVERLRFYLVLGPGAAVLLLGTYMLYPRLCDACGTLQKRWRPIYTHAALATTCVAFFAFILHFGNRQVGGYDFSILIDTGWRLASGQKPYRDFVCTLPPGFYLGAQYAFQLFGYSWDALLLMTSVFSCVTFLWLYRLLCALLETRLAAYFTGITIECAAMLSLSFWWYNNVTIVVACLFFLSCFLYVRAPERFESRLSYAGALLLLGLMKPNVAGLLAGGGILLVFVATRRRMILVWLTLAAVLGAVTLIAASGVSLEGMLASYRGVALTRGRLSTFGFNDYRGVDVTRVAGCMMALAAPLFLCLDGFSRAARRVEVREASVGLLFLLGPMVSVFAIFTNGELKDVEWTLFICSGALLLFGILPSPVSVTQSAGLRRFYVAFLCSLVAADFYIGAARFRVESTGDHMYFEWADNSSAPGVPFFRNLTGSARFRAVVAQIGQTLRESPPPVFLGPRMEFAYAAFRVPSPKHLPVWWHPGTSFAATDEPELLNTWRKNGFATLIFLKNDFTYYSPKFLSWIERSYARDDHFPELTVFHAKGIASTPRFAPESRSWELTCGVSFLSGQQDGLGQTAPKYAIAGSPQTEARIAALDRSGFGDDRIPEVLKRR